MKKTLLFTLLAGIISINLTAQDDAPKFKEPVENYIQSNYPPLRTGGEDISSAVSIPSFPFADNGTTCGAVNDYAAVCGCCGGSTGAPDLVYTFTAGSNGTVTIVLNDNAADPYDPLVHVRDSEGNVIACDDDSGGSLNALISNLAVVSGETYYIVVEGFSSDCGAYDLSITGTATVAPGTPISPWVIGLAIFLIGAVVVLRYTRIV